MLRCSAVLIFFTACSQNQYEPDNSIHLARFGSHYLTLKEAREAVPRFMLRQDSIKALKKYREEWIQQKLLLRKAENIQLEDRQPVQQRLQKARAEVLKSALRQAVLAQYEANTKISDEEALRYYENHKEQFVLQERYVRYRHISTDNFKLARAARQELLSGTPWPEVARLYSDEAEMRIRQSQKYWPQSAVLNGLPPMKQYIAALDSSEISPVRSINGKYHFVQLTGARAAGQYAAPEWIMKRLKEWIILEKKRRFFNSYIENLYLEAMTDNEIELYNVLIPDTQTRLDSIR